jgi:hypothetical protein
MMSLSVQEGAESPPPRCCCCRYRRERNAPTWGYPAGPEETLESIQHEVNYSLLNTLVLEMCWKCNHTFCTVDMDNYYTLPDVLILLRNCEIYTRGTVNKSGGMVPSQIVLTKANCKKEPNSFVRMAVCEFTKMQAFGWNDSNPLHVLSTADAS